jgi:hypothetical protein
VWILQKETDLARSFKRIKKMGRLPFHSLRSFHYERPIFPLLLKQLLQKQRYTTFLVVIMSPFVSADESIRERIEWIDIWVTDADKDDLPRVLLVGDSIARGYFAGVEQHLKGKAYCARLTTSKWVSNPTFNNDLQLLFKQYNFSVIHFNNGLHGWGYSEAEYQEGLQNTLEALKEHAGNVKLIWGTTLQSTKAPLPSRSLNGRTESQPGIR